MTVDPGVTFSVASRLAARGVLGDLPLVAVRHVGRTVGLSDPQTNALFSAAPVSTRQTVQMLRTSMTQYRKPSIGTAFLHAVADVLGMDVDIVCQGVEDEYGFLVHDRPHIAISG